ncbi:MAG: hypothetical protein IPG71_02940 [bacterium]|nr:hypothetical protein [bacterium]
MSKYLIALFAFLLAVLAGCARAPIPVKLSAELAEQVFSPKLSLQENGAVNCQWVEFHKDSIGGAGCMWNPGTRSFGAAESYDFLDRRWVQCIPQLDRFRFANQGTATLVAHSCIQESFIVFRDSTGKREAAWLAAPAVLTYPVAVDSLFLILFESPLDHGLICVWLDRGGREISRDTLDLPSPDFAAPSAGGVTLVKAENNRFRVFHMAALCSWVDSAQVARGYPAKQQIGTDYFTEGDDLGIVSAYRDSNNSVTVETHLLNGAARRSTHTAAIKRSGMGQVVAFRAVPSGENAPLLFALDQDGTRNEFWVLGAADEGYYSRKSRAGVAVNESLQEFCAFRLDARSVLAAYTCGDSASVAANSCYAVQLELE